MGRNGDREGEKRQKRNREGQRGRERKVNIWTSGERRVRRKQR